MKSALTAVVLILLATATQVATAQSGTSVEPLVGTWVLTGAQRESAEGETSRTRSARGVLILDRVGNVFEFFHTPTTESAEATLSGPQRNLAEFGGFWGTYAVDESGTRIAFSAADGVSPDVAALDFTREFEVDGDLLMVRSGDEPQAQGRMHWTWQRMPVNEDLSPAYAQVVGFWQHVEERRVVLEPREVQSTSLRAPSLIVYTPSGFVGVHFPPVGREPPGEDWPDQDAAQAAMRGYIGYFGTLGVFPGEVSHNILAGVSPGTGSILRRYADITGDELIVTLQSGSGRGRGNGPRTATEVVLRRLSGAEDMLPR